MMGRREGVWFFDEAKRRQEEEDAASCDSSVLVTAACYRRQHLVDGSMLLTTASYQQNFKPTAALGLVLSCRHLEAVQLQGPSLLRKSFGSMYVMAKYIDVVFSRLSTHSLKVNCSPALDIFNPFPHLLLVCIVQIVASLQSRRDHSLHFGLDGHDAGSLLP